MRDFGKHFFSSAVTMALVAGGAAPALAQSDDPYVGPYLGFAIGASDFEMSGGVDKIADTGLAYEGFFGWRQRTVGNVILGIEGHYLRNDAKDVTDIVFTQPADASYITSANLGRGLAVDAQIGVALGADQRLLAFAVGGFLNQKVNGQRLTLADEINPGETRAYSFNKDGYRIGGGLEYGVNNAMSLRATVYYADTGPIEQTQLLGGAVLRF